MSEGCHGFIPLLKEKSCPGIPGEVFFKKQKQKMPEAVPRFERRWTLRIMIFQGWGGVIEAWQPAFGKYKVVLADDRGWCLMEPRDLVLRMPTPVRQIPFFCAVRDPVATWPRKVKRTPSAAELGEMAQEIAKHNLNLFEDLYRMVQQTHFAV